MSIASINAIGQYVAEGDASNAKILDDAGNLLRRPVEEASYAGTNVVLGDFRAGFGIVDRLGMSLEVIPVVYNPSTKVHSGSRGVLAIWRSGSGVIDENAFVLLGTGGSRPHMVGAGSPDPPARAGACSPRPGPTPPRNRGPARLHDAPSNRRPAPSAAGRRAAVDGGHPPGQRGAKPRVHP